MSQSDRTEGRPDREDAHRTTPGRPPEAPPRGTWAALPTPFRPDGSVDLKALRAITRRCVGGGVDGLIPLGTTGESATVLAQERPAIVEACLESAGDTPVFVGTGCSDTQEVVRRTLEARSLGATGALVVTPYYNRPNRSGILGHFCEVAERGEGFPIVLYNVPARTGLNLAPETTLELLELAAVVSVKESSGNLDQIATVLRHRPDGTTVLAGDDALALPAISMGADGLVSVTANVRPRRTVRLVASALLGHTAQARLEHHRLEPLMRALFVETNPVPLKVALALLGLSDARVRLPLGAAEASTVRLLESVLTDLVEVAS